MLGSPVKSWHWLQNSVPRLRTLLFKVDIYYQCALCLNSGEVTYFLWFQGRQQIAANVIECRLVRCAPLYVIDIINNKARYNEIDAKYRQMAFQSVPTNPYLEFLVKQNWCKFRRVQVRVLLFFPIRSKQFSDEFEQKFPELSWAKLKRFRVKLSWGNSILS